MKLETVRECVLWNMLLEKQARMNDIISGIPEVFDDEKAALYEEVERNCKNYFDQEISIVVISTSGPIPDESHIDVYELDEMTNEIVWSKARE